MTQFAVKQTANSPPILRLPDELLDQILSDIDQLSHLISFALAAHACADLVIPRHTQYRIIRVRHSMARMWAHLARRADLARNIREVHICEQLNYSASDRYPSTLVDEKTESLQECGTESTRIANICSALGHMNDLKVFTWSWNVVDRTMPTMLHSQEDAILEVVVSKRSLKHLGLSGRFATHALGSQLDPKSISYSLWKASSLKSLCLLSDSCIKPQNSKHVVRMLRRSPDLEYLELPLEFSKLADCCFPKLKKLRLFLQSGATTSIDESRARFLENHPSIEELAWFPIGMTSFAPDSLPNLRRLRTGFQVIHALDNGSHITRPIEYLDVLSLDAERLASLTFLDHKTLTRLKLHTLTDLQSIKNLANVFPNITWLSLPYLHLPQGSPHPTPVRLDEWFSILSSFPKLEVFHGQGLWFTVQDSKDKMHLVIMRLVMVCPNLRELDHCRFSEKRHAWNRITILREKGHVSYSIKRPPPRNPFDIFDGAFD